MYGQCRTFKSHSRVMSISVIRYNIHSRTEPDTRKRGTQMAFLSVRDAARRLNVDERTIRRWIASKRLASSESVNGRLMISEEEIARVESQLQEVSREEPDELAALVAKVEAMTGEIKAL